MRNDTGTLRSLTDPDPSRGAKPVKESPSGETSDDYPHVVATIGPKARIIRCAQDLQFIAQTRGAGGWPWRATAYFVTRAGAARLPAPFQAPALALFDGGRGHD